MLQSIIKRRQLKKEGIILAKNTRIVKGAILEPPLRIYCQLITGDVKIGKYSYIGAGGEINNAEIGRFCSIATNVNIGASSHPLHWLSTHPFQYDSNLFKTPNFPGNYPKDAKAVIGNDVWIGSGVIVKSGIIIGDGAVIGAGSIVTRSIPAYAVAVGNPARILKYRFDAEIIQKLLTLKWWELSIDLLRNITFDDINSALRQLEAIKR
jgi:acetyltransferase-like isoleucine patch superfamily enzyme